MFRPLLRVIMRQVLLNNNKSQITKKILMKCGMVKCHKILQARCILGPYSCFSNYCKRTYR
jgi:hypothetical protein